MRGVRTTYQVTLALAAFLSVLSLTAPQARADGKVFAVEVADVSGAQIPDQSALICWDPATKTQTLAIETRFVGKGTEFGWVVPLPSRPEVKPGTKGMFPSLRGMFAPVVEKRGPGWGLFAVCCALICLSLVGLYIPSAFIRVLLFAVVILFLIGLMLPALGKARSSVRGGDTDGIEFIDRRIVGDFEVNTLEAPTGAAVVEWLRAHSFHIPPAVEKAIDQYAKEKWSFVATRLVRNVDSSEASTVHPLVFTFAADTPVYPMRLTGADATRDLNVELFVFGPSSATTQDFAAVAAGPVEAVEFPGRWARPSSQRILLSHPSLGPILRSSAFGTRLTATLTPAQMNSDVSIRWVSGEAQGRFAFAREAVIGLGWGIGSAVAFATLLALGFIERQRGWTKGTAIAGAMVLGAVSGFVVAAAVPSVSSVRVRERRSPMSDAVYAFQEQVEDSDATLTLAAAREKLDQFLGVYNEKHRLTIRRGDAPGEIELRAIESRIEVVYVNAAGNQVPHFTWLWRTEDGEFE